MLAACASSKQAPEAARQAPRRPPAQRQAAPAPQPEAPAVADPTRPANLAQAAQPDRADRTQRERGTWKRVRRFPVPDYSDPGDGPRDDFRDTVFWDPAVQTDEHGEAAVSFYLSDAITSFRATAEGITRAGSPTRGEVLLTSKLPVSLAVKLPLEVTRGDLLKLPITASNTTRRARRVRLTADLGAAFALRGELPGGVRLGAGEQKTFYLPLEVVGHGRRPADGDVLVKLHSGRLDDAIERRVRVVPRGYAGEVSVAGVIEGDEVATTIALPESLPGSAQAWLTLYPTPVATMLSGAEAIIREPHGCFEQASSSTYPNVMVMTYLGEQGEADPNVVRRARGAMAKGYRLLTGYESPTRGYEWFGGDPGHEALTAYGLMEFADMARVFEDVDPAVVERTTAWLLSRRDGRGGYERNSRALDSFGRASAEVTDAYITWALTEVGADGLEIEIERARRLAASTDDTYVLALAAGTLLNRDPDRGPATTAAVARLADMQVADGRFGGAKQSITRSGGRSLAIEATALATLALIDAGGHYFDAAERAVNWLQGQRSGRGGFGSTQGTVLTLKALTAWSRVAGALPGGGDVTVRLGGEVVGRVAFDGQREPLTLELPADVWRAGRNEVALQLSGARRMPYSLAIAYRTEQPDTSPQAAVSVATTLDRRRVPLGEPVRMKVRLANVTGQGQPMALARIGIPGGLNAQRWQLDELRDRGAIDFYETREREVIVYLRSMAPRLVRELDLELLATVPGEYVAPASSAYLYYTDEHRSWAAPTRIEVLP